MSIKINGRQLEITSTIREWVENRLKPIAEDPALKTTLLTATLGKEKNSFGVSLVLNCKYHVFSADATGFDLGKTFEEAARKLETQTRTLKDRIRSHKAEGLAASEHGKADEASRSSGE
jgi:ribosomal subunit interface protein